MQLRSGNTTSSSRASTSSRSNAKQVRDPSYKLSKVEQAKLVVREQVKERQRKAVEKYIKNAVRVEKSVRLVSSVLAQMLDDAENPSDNVDPAMHKIRVLHIVYKYVNSVPRHIMTSSTLLNLVATMLKKGNQISIDWTNQIKMRIECALSDPQLVKTRGEEGIRQYYNLHLEYMQDELTKFEKAYGNYL